MLAIKNKFFLFIVLQYFSLQLFGHPWLVHGVPKLAFDSFQSNIS